MAEKKEEEIRAEVRKEVEKEKNNLRFYERHRNPPKEALKPIIGGRLKGMSDINPMWRIKALTDMFGPVGVGWYYKTKNKWLESTNNEVVAFVDIELFVKVDGEWSMPIEGTGGSKLVAKESSGFFVSDECYKMATTDAISVSCKQLGIGADVYWQNDTAKYQKEAPDTKEQTQKQQVASENPPTSQPIIDKIKPEQITLLSNMIVRKGFSVEKTYLNGIENITVERYEKDMGKLSKLPDKGE